jgi:hypothetical protein
MPVEWQGQSMGGGDSVGGVEATVTLNTSGIDTGLAELQTKLASLGGRLEALGAKGGVVESGMTKAGGGVKNLGYQMLLVGQTVDDLQYGFSAVVNQLPQLATAFGMGAGLAGAVSVAGVAINQLTKHWGDMQAALGLGIPVPALEGMEKLAARTKEVDSRIEELRKKKRLDIVESDELKRLTAEREALKAETENAKNLERITGGRGKEGKARGAAFEAAVAEGGGKFALEALVDALKARADEKGRVGVVGAEVGTPKQVAEELFRNAASGDKVARDSIVAVLGGRNAFAESIREMSPETAARREAEDRFEKEGVERAQQAAKAAAEMSRGRMIDVMVVGDLAEMEEEVGPAKFATKNERMIAEREEKERKRAKDLLDLQTGHARRLNEIFKPEERQSQVFSASDLNARVQGSVTDGMAEQTKKIIEVRDEIVRFHKAMERFQQPVWQGGR